MATLWTKGSGFNAEYSSPDFPVLTGDWTGSASIYRDGALSPVKTWALTLAGNVMTLAVAAADILALDVGAYSLHATMTNAVIGISLNSINYVTVLENQAFNQPMTTLTMTIGKRDGTATGTLTKTLTNTDSGTVLVNGWKGVEVTASYPAAEAINGVIFGIERTRTETNAAGYAQIAVIKGSTVTVSCPSFGKTITVDTTDKDSIDLSEFF